MKILSENVSKNIMNKLNESMHKDMDEIKNALLKLNGTKIKNKDDGISTDRKPYYVLNVVCDKEYDNLIHFDVSIYQEYEHESNEPKNFNQCSFNFHLGKTSRGGKEVYVLVFYDASPYSEAKVKQFDRTEEGKTKLINYLRRRILN